MIVDRMQIAWEKAEDVPDYGLLFLILFGKNNVNEYGGSDESDADKLDLITNAAPGSTCLFTNGSIYRKDLDGWHKFGGETEETSANTNSISPTMSQLNIGRAQLVNDLNLSDVELDADNSDSDEEIV